MELSTNKQKAFDSCVEGDGYQEIMVRVITQAVRRIVALAKCTMCLFWLLKRALSGFFKAPK